jgi:hypothetical protein
MIYLSVYYLSIYLPIYFLLLLLQPISCLLFCGSEEERMEGHSAVRAQQFLTMRISLLLLFSV